MFKSLMSMYFYVYVVMRRWNKTIIQLGIPLRICFTCKNKLHSFNEFKQICVKNTQRLEETIKDNDQKYREVYIKEEILGETATTPETNDCTEEISIKEEPLQENVDNDQFYMFLQDPLKEESTTQTQLNTDNADIDVHEVNCVKNQRTTKEDKADLNTTMSDSSSSCTPHSEINEAAGQATLDLLPERSKERYLSVYNNFKLWCNTKNTKKMSENVLLAYFMEKSKVYKSSSLWSQYSMLKSTLNVHENVNIEHYSKLIAFVKHKNHGYKSKKSNILTKDDIYKFLINADDNNYLMMKVVLILGISGACRRIELTNIVLDHIEDKGTFIIVNIPDTKTKTTRQFTVTSICLNGVNFLEIYRKYAALRPQNVGHRRLFLTYKCGKCTVQPVGINTMGKIAEKIAVFLKLPNPKNYTGHCFRRSSATLLADTGADLINLQRHDSWRCSTVPTEGCYSENSFQNKIKPAAIGTFKSTSTEIAVNNSTVDNMNTEEINVSLDNTNVSVSHYVNISNCNNCVINVHKQ